MVKGLPSSPASSCSPVHTRVIAYHENQDRYLVVKYMDLRLEEPELISLLSIYINFFSSLNNYTYLGIKEFRDLLDPLF